MFCGPLEHKSSLFAGELLLFVSSPLISVPNIFKLLKDFGSASRLQVNMFKSKALYITFNPSLVEHLQTHFSFSWSSESILYLGVHLDPNIDQLYKVNYPSLYKKLGEDLSSWSRHDLSWLGQINSVKMTLLPGLLYLFRSLLIPRAREHT